MAATGICCETCSAFVKVNHQTGHCHANPPHPFLMPGPPGNFVPPGQPNIVVHAIWPPVGVNDWCGKHHLFGAAASMPIDDRLAIDTDGRADA